MHVHACMHAWYMHMCVNGPEMMRKRGGTGYGVQELGPR